MIRPRPTAWLVAALALFVVAVAGYALLVHAFPQDYWQQTDATVYRDGGIAVRRHPSELYTLPLGVAKLPFTYTPFSALTFALPSVLSFTTWQVTLAITTIGLLPVAAYLALGLAGRPHGTARVAAAFAIAAVSLWLEPVMSTLLFGQINLVLLVLVVGDLALPDRVRAKGVGIGLAAGVKLTPLVFIPYLLLTRRIRAAVVAAATFAGTVALGFAVLPHASAAYWWDGKFSQPGDGPWHLVNQSVNGVAQRLTHAGANAHTLWLAGAILAAAVGLATAIVAARRGHPLLGMVVCAATGLLVSPISWTHHYVYVVPALALAACGPRRPAARAAGVAAIIALFAAWPIPIGDDGGYNPSVQLLPRGLLRLAPHDGANLEYTWRGFELIVGNYYVIVVAVFIVATAVCLARTRRRADGPSEAARTEPVAEAVTG